jgi:hypothetical protein
MALQSKTKPGDWSKLDGHLCQTLKKQYDNNKIHFCIQYLITIAISLPPKTHSKESEKLRTAKDYQSSLLLSLGIPFCGIENRQQIYPRPLITLTRSFLGLEDIIIMHPRTLITLTRSFLGLQGIIIMQSTKPLLHKF